MREQGFEACCNGLFIWERPAKLSRKKELKWIDGYKAAFYAGYFNANREVA